MDNRLKLIIMDFGSRTPILPEQQFGSNFVVVDHEFVNFTTKMMIKNEICSPQHPSKPTLASKTTNWSYLFFRLRRKFFSSDFRLNFLHYILFNLLQPSHYT